MALLGTTITLQEADSPKQMLPGYVFFIIFIIALYIYTNENRQLAATASAVRQIWSGGCRLSCRHSEYSGLSGLSGLDRSLRRITSRTSNAGPSHGCVCEACPCALVENVLRKCDPVTDAYTNIYDSIVELYDNVLKTVSDIQDYVSRVSECGVSCQRQTLANDSNTSIENYPLPEKNDKEKSLDKLKRSLSKLRSSSAMSKLSLVKKSSSVKLNGASLSEKRNRLEKKASKESTVSAKVSRSLARVGSESEESSGCPRCMEKGKVCIGGCPKAAINKNKQ